MPFYLSQLLDLMKQISRYSNGLALLKSIKPSDNHRLTARTTFPLSLYDPQTIQWRCLTILPDTAIHEYLFLLLPPPLGFRYPPPLGFSLVLLPLGFRQPPPLGFGFR